MLLDIELAPLSVLVLQHRHPALEDVYTLDPELYQSLMKVHFQHMLPYPVLKSESVGHVAPSTSSRPGQMLLPTCPHIFQRVSTTCMF